MKRQFGKESNKKIYLYAAMIALIGGITAVVLQDIQAPVEHITQDVAVNLEK